MHRIASTFSLIALVGLCLAGPFRDLERKTHDVKDPQVLLRVLKNAPEDGTIESLTNTIASEKGTQQKYAIKTLRNYLETRSAAEDLGTDGKVLAQIEKIKKSPLYRDEDVQEANWFGKAGQALTNWLKKLLSFNLPKSNGPDMAMPGLLGPWLVYMMWGILGCLVIALAYIALRHASWKKRLRRKATALLEEDEPERTLDEWLERADQLEQAGQYREAVRCLYLACLLRFDEARIARFDRGQTNWEHLARIQASPLLPVGLDFEPTTKAFDHIWYGMRTNGKPDVEMFRNWYMEITDRVIRKAA